MAHPDAPDELAHAESLPPSTSIASPLPPNPENYNPHLNARETDLPTSPSQSPRPMPPRHYWRDAHASKEYVASPTRAVFYEIIRKKIDGLSDDEIKNRPDHKRHEERKTSPHADHEPPTCSPSQNNAILKTLSF